MMTIRSVLCRRPRRAALQGLLALGLVAQPLAAHAFIDYSKLRDSKGCLLLERVEKQKRCNEPRMRPASLAPVPQASRQFRAPDNVPPEVLNLQLAPPPARPQP
ncbi:hypothetical protein [Chitinilyticum litopenaei]|uniref:hypothetical protein n=1 Tax=Chitinilyticum litopenaei TaxID=1121276 RepID=UPI000490CF83|nr:hypothetical protein [Chitinilyticum litopenaei]